MNSISRQTTSFFDMPHEMADNLPQSRDFHLPKIIFFQGQFTDEISFFCRLELRSNAQLSQETALFVTVVLSIAGQCVDAK